MATNPWKLSIVTSTAVNMDTGMDTDMATDMNIYTKMDMEWTWNQTTCRGVLQKKPNGYESARRKNSHKM